MYNKLIILTLAILLTGAVHAQESSATHDKGLFTEKLQENKIDIYPNPAVEYLIIQVSNSKMAKTEFELHSIIGNQMSISVQDLGLGKFRIPVENLSTGYYFLIVKDEETRFKKAYKFLKD